LNYITNTLGGALLACSTAFVGTGVTAATLTFDGAKTDPYTEDGFVVDPARIVNGNCDSASGAPCLALNDNETSTVTANDGSAFSLTSFWFQLLGRGTDNTLTVTSSGGGSLSLDAATYGRNDGGQVFDLTTLADYATAWSDILSVTFSKTGGGNVRIDDIGLEGGGGAIAPVPVPAAGLLMLGALGGLAMMRRRRRA
jgi:hypothetical protein